jgi:hypothetical protein
LRVFNVLGQEVAILVDAVESAGTHTVLFDASSLPSGVYLCRMEALGLAETRKMIVLK